MNKGWSDFRARLDVARAEGKALRLNRVRLVIEVDGLGASVGSVLQVTGRGRVRSWVWVDGLKGPFRLESHQWEPASDDEPVTWPDMECAAEEPVIVPNTHIEHGVAIPNDVTHPDYAATLRAALDAADEEIVHLWVEVRRAGKRSASPGGHGDGR